MTSRIERDINSLGFEIEVTLVWRRSGQILDERRGFKRWERTKSRRLGDRGHEFVALYALDGRTWRQVWKSEWPTHFVQVDKNPPAPKIPRPDLEGPPPDMSAAHADIARRAVRAFEVDRALTDQEKGWLKVGVYGLLTRPGPGDYPPEQITRDRPTPAEVTDYLDIMKLVAALDREEKARGVDERRRAVRLIRLRSFGLSFRSIADRIDTHEQTAREDFKHAVRRLAELDESDASARPGEGARSA